MINSNWAFNQGNIVSGNDIDGDNSLDYHVIVADHPYMNEIGLGAFTLKELYNWLIVTDKAGNFTNLRYINNTKLNKKDCLENEEFSVKKFLQQAQPQIDQILGNSADVQKETIYAWRRDAKKQTGEYVKYENIFKNSSVNNWKYGDFTYQDLYLDEINQNRSQYIDNGYYYIDNVISPIVFLNDWFVYSAGGQSGELNDAQKEFIRDIKSSKFRFVEWKACVPFFLSLGADIQTNTEDQDGCIKTELVTYRLYLYDQNVNRDTSRTITLATPMFVGPKTDPTGRSYSNKVDGTNTQLSLQNSPTQNVAGNIDLVWDELGNSWESGTRQILATLATNIPSATQQKLEDVQTKSIEDLLKPENSAIFPTGKAIPILMQNANPLQWGPEYLKYENCRESEDIAKNEIVVHNPSLKSWKAGELVLLQRIQSAWIISQIAETQPEELVGVGVSNWDFMYLMTNAHFYFRGRAADNDAFPFSYNAYEQGFYRKYYNKLEQTERDYTKVSNSYFQVTSFDFMGPSIGGLRTYNGLAATRFGIDASGIPLENNGEYVLGEASAPFFGCVFPDGYTTGDKYELYRNLPEKITAKQILEKDSDAIFFKDINEGTDVFENKNANTASANANGMFVINDITALQNLPADIALNASFKNGVKGSPVKNIKYFSKFDTPTNSNNFNFRNQVKTYFSDGHYKGNWLYIGNDEDNSAFDFLPVSNKIQFRPLKLEVYAAFEHTNRGSADNAYNNGSVYGRFGAESWRIMSDGQCPIGNFSGSTNIVYTRNKNNNLGVSSEFNYESLFAEERFAQGNPNNYRGLGYNISAFNTDNTSNLNPIPPDTSKFPLYWWTKPWTLSPARGAGAVGIIAASCTVTANSAINLNTDYYLGVGSQFNIAGGLSDQTPWDPAWGGYGGDNYFSLQTTQLFARVFQAWPKHLTVYDPRFFAVHHFNDGVELICDTRSEYNPDDPNSSCVNKDLYLNGVKVNNPPDSFTILYPSGYYYVDRAESPVDMRIPTYYQLNAKTSHVAPVGAVVFSKTQSIGWRKTEEWAIDPQRRGKLLPYVYSKRTVSLERENNISCYIQGESLFAPTSAVIKIFTKGTGYKDTDTFTVSGGDGINENYVLNPICQNDEIVGFNYKSGSAYDYSPSNFLEQNDVVIINASTTTVKITPLVVTGKGFNGGFIRGRIYDIPMTDEKPKQAGSVDLIQLTPNSPGYPFLGSPNFIDPLNGEQTNSVKIVNKSSNNKYDIFLHFHNDISYTAMKDWSNGAGGPLGVENHVTLTISPE